MVRLMWRDLRHRPGRAIAQMLGVALATMGFALLTATASTSTLNVVGTVDAANRPVYDILVRPSGSQLDAETRGGLVQPGCLSGIYGGITLDQWRKIQAIPGVGVAAPVAMIGYATPSVPMSINLSRYVGAGRQVLRVELTWISDRGLTEVAGQPTQYVYSTDRPLEGGEYALAEIGDDGRAQPVCRDNRPRVGPLETLLRCGSSSSTPPVRFGWTFPYLVAAVDPIQEAKLAGLDQAVVSGRYFDASDRPATRTAPVPGSTARDATWTEIPVLIAARAQVDRELRYRVVRLPASAAETIAHGGTVDQLGGVPGEVIATGTLDSADAYSRLLGRFEEATNVTDRSLPEYFSTGPVTYRPSADGALAPGEVAVDRSAVWDYARSGAEAGADMPEEAADPLFRPVEPHRAIADDSSPQRNSPLLSAVGRFDVAELPAWNELSAVPMETYFSAGASPADDNARRATGGRNLLPSANIGGFLGQAPSMLTTLDSLPILLGSDRFSGVDPSRSAAPLSVVRVRLPGDLGLDDISREKIRVVAEEIAHRTGLAVDIMVGSSPTSVPVMLPAGTHGRPALALTQSWAKKGVAATIIDAVDRKSVLLFSLILGVCTLFVANATAASVRSRRYEFAVLACLGWRRRTLYRRIVTESAAYGVIASLAGAALTLPTAALLHMNVNLIWLLVVVPVATVLTVMAALGPARQAGRSDPAGAIRPPVVVPRRSPAPRTVVGLAVANLLRSPGRTLLGAASLAIGVCSLTFLTAISRAFEGAVVGSLLGDAVSVQARAGDFIAATATLVLGTCAVADVVFVSVRERGVEFATLRAVGWRERDLARAIGYETVLIGVIGAVSGLVIGLAILAALAGTLPAQAVPKAMVVGLGGVVLAGLAAAVPVAAVSRLSTMRLLSE